MFTHLHVHSHYSLLDGFSKIDELIAQAKKFKMKSIALTDHGVMYGSIEFYQKAKQAGIKPIIGMEAYLARDGRLKKTRENRYHITLLAKNNQGYKNLLKLTSIAHLEGFYYKPRIDHQVLKKYSQGIIALSGCLQGEIPQLIISQQIAKADKAIKKYISIFGKENFYLEIQDHPSISKQETVNKTLKKLASKHKLELVASADVHYIKKEDDKIQDILLCIQTKKKINDKDRLSMLGEAYSLHSPAEMKEKMKKYPKAIANTEKIAKKCNVEIELNKPRLPYFPLPKGKTDDEYLKELCVKNISKKYPNTTTDKKQIKKRLSYELKIISKTGFSSYFLIVQDFVEWSKKNKIVIGPGRGSAAGSIISYLLGITNIDPLKYGLLFERFMTENRISPPDIDLDFADTRRDEVIEYVEEKYGRDHVAQIITFGTMASRAAIRDVGRVLDFPYSFCDKLAKMIPMGETLENSLKISNELRSLYQSNQDAKKIIDYAKRLEGTIRHASKHACGLVISPEPLSEYTPIQYDISGKEKTIITQYEMHAIEDIGLLKMDFLGLKNLTIIENTIKILKKTQNKIIDINKISLTNKKAFDILKKANTKGVFQLESDGMKRYLKQIKPNHLDDIISIIALYRPGPMELIPEYIARKNGKKKIEYIHPKLKPILANTYGIAVYQEQVLEIVRELASFTISEADVLRKAVGKKIPKLLKAQKQKFIKGCIKNKINENIAIKIFSFIEPFAQYAFNKSHSACYAMIAYQTAFLKANYPVEFMASLLISNQKNIEEMASIIEEAKKINIDVLPPEINESYKNFTVLNNKIRFGLLAIKNVGQGIVKEIIDEREENGLFQSLENFLDRVNTRNLNKKSLESLIKSGAMDCFGERNQLFQNTKILLDFARKKQREKNNGQKNLFKIINFGSKMTLKLKKYPTIEHQQKLLWEKELLGLFLSSHPLKEYQKIIKKYSKTIKQIKEAQSNFYSNTHKIVGIITKIKKITTHSKENMLFVKIEDTTGEIEAIIFPNLLKTNKDVLKENTIVAISGRLSTKDGSIKIIAEKIKKITKNTLDELLLKS